MVIVDWGMACLGPRWSDLFVLALTWADRPEFDELMQAADERTVTDLLTLLGGSQAWRAATRLFAGAARRLGVASPA